ncbi:MAG: biotin-dependent carboxyltransferase family protein [Vicinamibacterales bacterium]
MTAGATVTVARPGLLTTVQDLGRWGHQAMGVPVAGPMDTCAHRAANALAGNRPAAASLEITLIGPELVVSRAVRAAVAGAVFDVAVNGTPVPSTGAFDVPAGGRLAFGRRRSGARAYLAFAGGIDTAPVLGSRATHLVSGMGGLEGRALTGGDVLPLGQPPTATTAGGAAPPSGYLPEAGRARLRVLPGPQDAWFAPHALEALASASFTVATASNRMAYTLEGPPLPVARAGEPLSEPVPFGAIQVPAGGAPLLLMADRQTAGGYLKIATVILADLPVAGQLAPGDVVGFVPCTRAEAMRALIDRERALLRAAPGAATS